MSMYLSMALAGNRKGRFLQSVVGADPLTADWLSSPPDSGLVLVQGEELADAAVLQRVYLWSMQPGCAVLMVSPQAAQLALLAQLPTPLDWQLVPAKCEANAQESELANLLASEIDQAIVGFAGSADSRQHKAGDAVHTRYVRKHSNSGLMAVTTLPLWSLSLLDHPRVLVEWLNWFVSHAGVVEPRVERSAESSHYTPDKQDLVVLLLLYAGRGMSLQTVAEHDAVKLLFDVKSLDIAKRGEILRKYGFIDEAGVTDTAIANLRASHYWAYAPLLREQLTLGAL